MKIAMLARNRNLYSHKRLMEAAEAGGHRIDVINTTQCYANITSDSPQLLYRGAILDDYDAVIPRIGASITFYGLAVLRQFEMMGVWTLNESEAIGRARDKLWALQIMSRLGIGLPVTGFANSARRSEDLIRMVGGPPVVIKLVEGTQGLGVVLGETMPSAKSTFEAFRRGEDQHPGAGIRQGSGGRRHSGFRRGRPRGWGDEAPERAGRVPIQPSSRGHGGGDCRHAGGALGRGARLQGVGAERGRGGHASVQSGAGADRGELDAGAGRNRAGHGGGHCGADNFVHGNPRQTHVC